MVKAIAEPLVNIEFQVLVQGLNFFGVILNNRLVGLTEPLLILVQVILNRGTPLQPCRKDFTKAFYHKLYGNGSH
jgi:hypothetical protein